MNVVGITGTNGKTTITYLIEAILRRLNKNCGVIGTVNYRYKGTAVIAKNTTPGPVELQSVLRDMADAGVEYVAMEVSSHALDQQRIEGTSFHSAIFTNLTQDHLDYHGNLKNYFSAKAKLFQGLKACSLAVINNDDAYGRRLKAMTSAEVVTYGIESESDVTARDIEMDVSGTRFTVVGSGLKMKCVTRLIGRHNVYNLLAAIAWALKEKIPQEAIQSAIGQFESVPGRLQRIEGAGGVSVFVDYAHTEDALKNVLQSFSQLPHRRIITVFGCGGERDKTKRPKMGAVVTKLSDHAIITNDNPRSEDPERIIADIREGIKKNNYQVIQDRYEAIKSALTMAQEGDIVLIAGKGHEDYQIFKDKTIHFDDGETVRSCLKSKS
jgi:UDP-N-acetylmuramoyl-L-alanyl-D-glutamate--2,6-diaminopimelate ligase